MNSKLCFLILGLLLIWSCTPSNDRESEKEKEIIEISDSKLNDSNDSLNNEQEDLKNKDLELDSSESLVKKIMFSYSSINEDQFRLNMENGHIEIKVVNKHSSGHLSWETIDKVNISFEKRYQLCTLLKPKYNDEGDIYTVNLFVVINKSNGDIFYKEQDSKEWKNISTKNLEICDNCYSFDYRYNINFFEFSEATNDSTNEVFNLIGHKGEITRRQSWIWEKGKCKEADWR